MALLVDDFERPNGLGFSPDEKTHYIDDSHHQHIRAFDVTADGTLENGRLFCDLASDSDGVPDGLEEIIGRGDQDLDNGLPQPGSHRREIIIH